MKIINIIFEKTLEIQEKLKGFEDWYQENRKYSPIVIYMSIFITIILFLFNMPMLASMIFALGMFIVGIGNVIGWNHSVRKWLKLCVLYNFFFSVLLASMIQDYTKEKIFWVAFGTIYFLVWVFLSLISDCKVALLVNEITSGLVATFFRL